MTVAGRQELNFSNYKAFIFDFDGTLYDSRSMARSLILAAPRDIFCLRAERAARKSLRGSFFGSAAAYERAHEEAMFRAHGGFSSPREAGAWYKSVFMPRMTSLLSRRAAREGCAEVFARLRAHSVKTAVLSDYRDVPARMSAIGLPAGIADAALSSEELGGLKPAREIFEEIARRLGVRCADALVIGDRADTDGAGARSSGMTFVLIAPVRRAAPPGPRAALEWGDFVFRVRVAFPGAL